MIGSWFCFIVFSERFIDFITGNWNLELSYMHDSLVLSETLGLLNAGLMDKTYEQQISFFFKTENLSELFISDTIWSENVCLFNQVCLQI